MMGLRLSCAVHALLLLAGCKAYRPATAPIAADAETIEARAFVVAVSDKMPLWDADAIARFEQVEIATVKADIAMALQDEGRSDFLFYVQKLHTDWDTLVVLDERLKKESLL